MNDTLEKEILNFIKDKTGNDLNTLFLVAGNDETYCYSIYGNKIDVVTCLSNVMIDYEIAGKILAIAYECSKLHSHEHKSGQN